MKKKKRTQLGVLPPGGYLTLMWKVFVLVGILSITFYSCGDIARAIEEAVISCKDSNVCDLVDNNTSIISTNNEPTWVHSFIMDWCPTPAQVGSINTLYQYYITHTRK